MTMMYTCSIHRNKRKDLNFPAIFTFIGEYDCSIMVSNLLNITLNIKMHAVLVSKMLYSALEAVEVFSCFCRHTVKIPCFGVCTGVLFNLIDLDNASSRYENGDGALSSMAEQT